MVTKRIEVMQRLPSNLLPSTPSVPGRRSFSRRHGAGAVLVVALAAGVLAAAPASTAQEVTPPLSLEAVHNCLCLQQEMADRNAEMETRGGILREREGELERLGMEIEVKRAAMVPGDEAAITDLKTLIDRQQSLRELMRRDIAPSYQDSVSGYNEASAEYNATCAGRRIYQPDIDKLQGNLQCPVRP